MVQVDLLFFAHIDQHYNGRVWSVFVRVLQQYSMDSPNIQKKNRLVHNYQ